jgi:hypothetical protein
MGVEVQGHGGVVVFAGLCNVAEAVMAFAAVVVGAGKGNRVWVEREVASPAAYADGMVATGDGRHTKVIEHIAAGARVALECG